jgi:F0F1-type ATP synthase membrane subunit c/vacuolar-type H+-ATPase subunit K
MRALCGAIITAGALIGLGLTAIGIGERYSMEKAFGSDGEPVLVKLSKMDRPLIFILVFITCVAVIGLGIAIAGLAYHHLRRDREYLVHKERVVVPPVATP